MSSTGNNTLSTAAGIITQLTSGMDTVYHNAVTAVASWGLTELVKLTVDEVNRINASIQHFIANLKNGVTWGAAMASLLTEVWNGVKSELAMLATDFVEAVGKLLQSTGLLPVAA